MEIVQIGLDFGTTNTGVSAKFEDGSITILKNKGVEMKSFPSEIYFIDRDHYYVGVEAKEKAETHKNNGRHVRWIKRALPKKMGQVNIFSKAYAIEELVSIIMKYAKEYLETNYTIDWNKVVLNVGYPVILGDNNDQNELAKERIGKALSLAGFSKWNLIPEPIAVAHYYSKKIEDGKKCLIFDCGGGTTDLSFVEYNSELPQGFQVLGNSGIMKAGRDFDKSLFLKSIAPSIGYLLTYNFMGRECSIPRSIYDLLSSSNEFQFLNVYKHYKHVMEAVKIGKQDEFLNLKFSIDNNKSIYLLSRAEELKISLSTNNISSQSIVLRNVLDISATYHDLETSSVFIQGLISDLIEDFCSDKPEPDFIIMTGGMSKHRLIKNLIFKQFPYLSKDKFLYEETDAIVLGLASMD